MVMQRMGLVRRASKILHCAPEPGLFQKLSRISEDYTAADYNASAHSKWRPEVRFIDLCDIDDRFSGPFDLIVHNHVLEHLYCAPSKVLSELIFRLSDDGMILFSVPIRRNAITEEELSELSAEDRTRRFGQFDHLRMFGDLDVIDVLTGPEGNNIKPIDPLQYLSEEELEQNEINVDISQLS